MADATCRRKSCSGTVAARGLCKSHYDEERKAESRARVRRARREVGEVPVNGLGILRCEMCGAQLSEHSPGQSCRGDLRMELI